MKFLFVFLLAGAPLWAAEKTPVELENVGIEEHLGEKISLGLSFTTADGKRVPLQTYFTDKPVILNLVYHNCPNLCHYLLDGFTHSIKNHPFRIGKEFRVLTISIDPAEKSSLALKKQEHYIKMYGRDVLAGEWVFLTGDENDIRQLAREVGFKYRYDFKQKEYAHAAGIFILTPEGKISRTLYGIQFSPRDLRLSILEASQGKIGNVVDKLLLFCYHYDPEARKYAIFAVNLMKVGGAITLLFIVLLLVFLRKRK